MKIFIYGVPGSGKTYSSKKLGSELGLEVIEADRIKSKLRKVISKKDNPFLYLGTCQAYKEFGDLNQENVIKGLLSVRSALKNAVLEEIKDKDNFILEGAFLDPRSLTNLGKVILLTTQDESQHKKQFYSHREKLLDFKGEEFKASRIVQEYLIKEAKGLGIEVLESD